MEAGAGTASGDKQGLARNADYPNRDSERQSARRRC
jgi:hypothetical protein